MKVTIYSKNDCLACDNSKRLLTEAGVPFTDINVWNDEEAAQMIVDMGYRSVPVIHVDYGEGIEGDQDWSVGQLTQAQVEALAELV